MTNEELERAMQFLIEHHAKVSAQSDRNSEQIKLHSEQIKRNSEQIKRTSEQIAQLLQVVSRHSEQIQMMASQAETDRAEMRDGFNNLIVANEVTRELTETVARLALATSRRFTDLEP